MRDEPAELREDAQLLVHGDLLSGLRFGSRVQGSGCSVQDSGFKVEGFKIVVLGISVGR